MWKGDAMVDVRKKVDLVTEISGLGIDIDKDGAQSFTPEGPGMLPIGRNKKIKLGTNYGRKRNSLGIKNGGKFHLKTDSRGY